MKFHVSWMAAALYLAVAIVPTSAAPLGTLFTYQGRLSNGSTEAIGLFDFEFRLFDSPGGVTQIGGAITNSGVGVTNGFFNTTLDFGAVPFNGTALWLNLQVRPAGVGAFTPLSPRQRLTPTPYALYAPQAGAAATAGSASTAGTAASATTATTAATANSVVAGAINNAALANGAVDSSKIADGSIAENDLSSALLSNTFWRLLGNAGTTSGAHFLGTTDNQPLEFKVNGARAWRLEPNATSPNVIGGYGGNLVSNGVVGAVIAGGGSLNNTNRVGGSFSTVGGGDNNVADQDRATVSGGFNNRAQGLLSTVAGGDSGLVSGIAGTIGGGSGNTVSNAADYATIPGGRSNTAGGAYAFAAGRQARANHPGAFVWADSTALDFSSTANNQFLVRASGGAGVNTNDPAGAALNVAGVVRATSFEGFGAGVTGLNAGNLATGTVSDLRLPGNLARLNATQTFTGVNTFNANVGVNTTTPRGPLEINTGAGSLIFRDETLAPSLTVSNAPFEGVLRFRHRLEIWPNPSGTAAGSLEIRAANGAVSAFLPGSGDGYFTAGNFGLGISAPTTRLDVDGDAKVRNSHYVRDSLFVNYDSRQDPSFPELPGILFGDFNSGEVITSQRGTNGPNRYGLDIYTDHAKRISIAKNGNVGIGAAEPATKLHVAGDYVRVDGAGGEQAYLGGDGFGGDVQLGSFNPGVGAVSLWNAANANYMDLYVRVLHIVGGSDLAEPFEMSEEKIAAGSVVVIDEDHPGQLKLSTRAYDTRVAGVVSGAGGVNAGIQLKQKDVLERGQNVALTGRVYVLADADSGTIKPGDLLTTAATPGHAMKVGEPARAQGAILGKAMTSLAQGRGLVLMLVTLQ